MAVTVTVKVCQHHSCKTLEGTVESQHPASGAYKSRWKCHRFLPKGPAGIIQPRQKNIRHSMSSTRHGEIPRFYGISQRKHQPSAHSAGDTGQIWRHPVGPPRFTSYKEKSRNRTWDMTASSCWSFSRRACNAAKMNPKQSV